MQRDVKALIDGGIGGGVATAAMSAVMLAAQRAGLLGRHPPEHIAERALHIAGIHKPSEETQDALATFLHFAFGMGMGALFGVLQRRVRVPIGGAPLGIVFGSLVWAVSYKGWIPAFGIMPPPERDRPGRPQSMVLAHWVYGGTLGGALDLAADLRARGRGRDRTGTPDAAADDPDIGPGMTRRSGTPGQEAS